MWFIKFKEKYQLPFKTGSFTGISGNAIFNQNCNRRYFLEKRWAAGGDILTAIMMNPSSAAHNQSDQTVDQLINVAKLQGCHALYVVNVSSVIQGTSSKLKAAQFAYESINWSFINKSVSEAKYIFLGWGMKGQRGINNQKKVNPRILNIFKKAEMKLYCYEVLKSLDKNYANKPFLYLPHPRPQKFYRDHEYKFRI